MSPAMIQFLVAGTLVVAWTWMLGRPLLSRLAPKPHRRPAARADHGAEGGAAGGIELAGPVMGGHRLVDRLSHPIGGWRSQPIERRRLQVLLGFAFATFAASLLAIAVRGPFVRLFLLMAACFCLHLIVAAYIGSRQLRAVEVARRHRVIQEAAARARRTDRVIQPREEAAAPDVDLVGGLGGGLFDEGFFEPIPELGARTADGVPVTTGRSIFDPRPEAEPAPAGTTGGPVGEESDEAGERVDQPTFKVAPRPSPSPPRRTRGRPIYVEPRVEVDDGAIRAVND